MKRPDSPAGHRWSQFWLYVSAFAWPWGEYASLYHGWGLFHLAAAVLFIVLVGEFFRRGRPQIPFDLLWPAMLIPAGTAVVAALRGDAQPLGVMIDAGAFLAALNAAQSLPTVFRAFALGVSSAAAVAILTGLAEYNFIFPTFFSAYGGAIGAGPETLADALFLFAWAMLLAAVLFPSRKALQWRFSGLLLVSTATLCLIAFTLLARRLQGPFATWVPHYSLFAFPLLPLSLLGLYLGSRIAARIWVLGAVEHRASSRLLALVLLAIGVICAFSGYLPSPGLSFSAGLVAALGVPRVLRNGKTIRVRWAVLAVMVPVLAHSILLFPGDARDYRFQAMRTERTGKASEARDFLRRVLARRPAEAAARFELALRECWCGNTSAAADQFLAALRESRCPQLYPKPGADAVSGFLETMRENCVQRPGTAYERCLVVARGPDAAIASIKSRASEAEDLDIDPGPMRRALAALLGLGDGGVNRLEQWKPGELVAALRLFGPWCEALKAPEGFPQDRLPMVLASRPLADGRMIQVFFPGGQTGRAWTLTPCSGLTPGEGEALWLAPAADAETGVYYITLAGTADVYVGPQVTITPVEDPRLDCGPGAGEWAVLCLLP